MNKFFYSKIALMNLQKNKQTWVPYLLNCTAIVMMFYLMHFLSVNSGLNQIYGGSELKVILGLGVGIIGIFSVIFLFYTNSFLMKRRKTEFGLFHVLGMEKKHIGKVIALETFFTAFFSIVVGLLLGIAFSGFLFMFLFQILHYPISFRFQISWNSISTTWIFFSIFFLVLIFYNIWKVSKSNSMELLKSEKVGERAPKSNWIFAFIGFISLGTGYYIALSMKSPLAALLYFFVAAILVIIGTCALFTAGSVVFLKLLKRKKKFYYRPKQFIALSGMIHRMKQNAIGLANICILSTMVLITVSTTFSLYMGMENLLRTRFPRNMSIQAYDLSVEQSKKLADEVKTELKMLEVEPLQVKEETALILVGVLHENILESGEALDYVTTSQNVVLTVLTESDYTEKTKEKLNLKDGEAAFLENNSILQDELYIRMNGVENHFQLKNGLDRDKKENKKDVLFDNETLIVKEEMVRRELAGKNEAYLTYSYAFDLPSQDREQQQQIVDRMNAILRSNGVDGYVEGSELARESFFILYGGLFFLGIFLGTVFLLATVLIIYYKQISEGYEDRERFIILQQVGMSKNETKAAIRNQVLMVFFLPLFTAFLHVLVAFPAMTRILAVLNLTDVRLFAACTIGIGIIFFLFYIWVYSRTARSYYRIVKIH